MMDENCKFLVFNLLSSQLTMTLIYIPMVSNGKFPYSWNAAHVPDSVCF